MDTFVSNLAIVIPAYKIMYFDQALESFANQTCKNFTLYIGDDASPDNLEEIVEKYKSGLSIVYHRFKSNLGSTDLVAHWERCIDLTQDEEWIWLFSDDDIASPDCVSGFFETLDRYMKENVFNKVFRFNLYITDQNLKPVNNFETPATFSVEYFLENYFITHKFNNRAVEFVFSRFLYNSEARFVKFPLAWGSDLATALKFGQKEGFFTINTGKVYWRSSEFNISGNNAPILTPQKVQGFNQYYLWIFGFIQEYSDNQFFYKILYRVLHYITIRQAFSKIEELRIMDNKQKAMIILMGIFIKLKRPIRYRKLKQKLLKQVSK